MEQLLESWTLYGDVAMQLSPSYTVNVKLFEIKVATMNSLLKGATI